MFAGRIDLHDAIPLVNLVAVAVERIAQPRLLRSHRAVATEVQHEALALAELIQVGDLLRNIRKCLPPGFHERTPLLAFLVAGVIQLIEAFEESGNAGVLNDAADRTRPSLE